MPNLLRHLRQGHLVVSRYALPGTAPKLLLPIAGTADGMVELRFSRGGYALSLLRQSSSAERLLLVEVVLPRLPVRRQSRESIMRKRSDSDEPTNVVELHRSGNGRRRNAHAFSRSGTEGLVRAGRDARIVRAFRDPKKHYRIAQYFARPRIENRRLFARPRPRFTRSVDESLFARSSLWNARLFAGRCPTQRRQLNRSLNRRQRVRMTIGCEGACRRTIAFLGPVRPSRILIPLGKLRRSEYHGVARTRRNSGGGRRTCDP